MEITLTEFIEKLQALQREIGCDGERVGSHKLKSHVNFVIDHPDIDLDIELDDSEYPMGMELDLMFNCLCPYGITIHLKAV
jgi:hypothetical protein